LQSVARLPPVRVVRRHQPRHLSKRRRHDEAIPMFRKQGLAPERRRARDTHTPSLPFARPPPSLSSFPLPPPIHLPSLHARGLEYSEGTLAAHEHYSTTLQHFRSWHEMARAHVVQDRRRTEGRGVPDESVERYLPGCPQQARVKSLVLFFKISPQAVVTSKKSGANPMTTPLPCCHNTTLAAFPDAK
jgi:hypothetical protein